MLAPWWRRQNLVGVGVYWFGTPPQLLLQCVIEAGHAGMVILFQMMDSRVSP